MRVGILTGGGDAPGLNAVIRACVKSLHTSGEIDQIIGFEDGFKGLVTNTYLDLTFEAVCGILHIGGTILGTTNRDNPFAFNLDGEIKDCSQIAVDVYNSHSLDVLVVIGGDGTLKIAHELSLLGINVIGVPKTIDNDLALTDMTFGFMSAVNVATEALDRLHTTAESHHRVNILETMGRDAGWIALYSGVAGGADVILIPEIPYSIESIIEKIKYRESCGKKFSLIVMAEGASEVGSEKTYVKGKRLGKVSYLLEESLEELSIETRCTVLGHLQRGGSPSTYDRIIATQYGYKAYELVTNRIFNRVLVLQGNEINHVPLEEVSGIVKKVPLDHNLIKAARAIGVSFGD